MLGFETLTFAPIDRRLIAREMLSPAELGWLNDYHAQVLAKIGSSLSGEDRALARSGLRTALVGFRVLRRPGGIARLLLALAQVVAQRGGKALGAVLVFLGHADCLNGG